MSILCLKEVLWAEWKKRQSRQAAAINEGEWQGSSSLSLSLSCQARIGPQMGRCQNHCRHQVHYYIQSLLRGAGCEKDTPVCMCKREREMKSQKQTQEPTPALLHIPSEFSWKKNEQEKQTKHVKKWQFCQAAGVYNGPVPTS